jgi:hypothetical protein
MVLLRCFSPYIFYSCPYLYILPEGSLLGYISPHILAKKMAIYAQQNGLKWLIYYLTLQLLKILTGSLANNQSQAQRPSHFYLGIDNRRSTS